MKLTERDRHLCGVLAHARWLTTPQLYRLCFPGRHERDYLRRLHILSTSKGGAVPLLERHKWVTRDGVKHVWGLTADGYGEAGLLLDEELVVPPVDFEPETMAHHVALTELYVGLLAAPVDAALARVPPRLTPAQRQKALAGLYARAYHRAWRWTVVGDRTQLPWKLYEDGRQKDKVLRPDAVLELLADKRRLFIEAETGTHTVVPRHADNKPNSTMAKLDRWETYMSGLGDIGARRTWYQVRYPDAFAPEVIFLVHNEKRVATVEAAMSDWRRKTPGARLETRALTLSQVLTELGVAPPHPSVARAARDSFSKRVEPRVAAGVELTAAEVHLLVGFVNDFRKDFKRRKLLDAQQHPGPVHEPEGYEAVKGLAVKLSATLVDARRSQ